MFDRDMQIDQGLVNVPGACSDLENGDIMCNSSLQEGFMRFVDSSQRSIQYQIDSIYDFLLKLEQHETIKIIPSILMVLCVLILHQFGK